MNRHEINQPTEQIFKGRVYIDGLRYSVLKMMVRDKTIYIWTTSTAKGYYVWKALKSGAKSNFSEEELQQNLMIHGSTTGIAWAGKFPNQGKMTEELAEKAIENGP